MPKGLWFVSAIFVASGLLAILASAFNWDWFFKSNNARLLVGRLSRRGARIVYFIIGCLILAMVVAIHHRLSETA